MKKRYAILLATLALLCVLALLSACQKEPGNPSESNTDVPGDGTGTSATTETDSREEGSDTVPEGTVPETVPETETETETEKEKYSDSDACELLTSLLYREIFEKYYPGQASMVADFWMPNKEWEGCNVDDPSARVLSNYGDSGI